VDQYLISAGEMVDSSNAWNDLRYAR
jgi:hypothetical protein